jgi:hypothetical protein
MKALAAALIVFPDARVRAAMAAFGVWREHVCGDALRLLSISSASEPRAAAPCCSAEHGSRCATSS